MAHSTDPFLPGPPPTREQLERYVQGDLSATEQHAVELHLEADPLLREAAEGLQRPGALSGWRDLAKAGRGGQRGWMMRTIVAGVSIIALGTYFILRGTTSPASVAPQHVAPPRTDAGTERIPALVESTLQVVHAELDRVKADTETAVTIPTQERFQRALPLDRREGEGGVERIDAQAVTLERPLGSTTPVPARGKVPSRHTVFLHDLKLVDPVELYGDGGGDLSSPGVPANVDLSRTETHPAPRTVQRYMDFMDGALGAVAHGDDRRALDDLYFLLAQYPNDVNAQFYAGLVSYRLGLYPRAIRLLQAAASNPIDNFREEANWYAALSTLRKDGPKAARPALERIAGAGGFYAGQAEAALGKDR